MENNEETYQEENIDELYDEVMDNRKITLADIREHMTGPVISTILHVVLIAFLGTIIVFKAPEESKDIHVEMKVIEPQEIKPPPEPPEPPEPTEVEVEVEIDRPEVQTDNVEVAVDEPIAIQNTDISIEIPNVLNVKMTNSVLQMPALYQGRSGDGIKGNLKKHGGDNRTETAVLKGLRWLKDHQNADGSWGDSNQGNYAAYTGMALLAFLGHNETPSSQEFGPTVTKAIKKLCEYVGPNGDGVKGGYRHGIAMYALSEAYALTKIPMLEDVVNKGIQRIILGINNQGSYNYGYNNAKGRSDLSVAGWNYQALKAAFAAGCTAEGLEDAMTKLVNDGLKKTHYDSERQMFCYGAGSGPKSTMTAVGVLCLQLFGEGKSDEAKGGLETLQSPQYFWFNWTGDDSGKVHGWSLYQWYYQTQAIFQGNNGTGKIWKEWNAMFKNELIAKQKKDGRWETPAYEHNPAKGGHGEAMFKGLDQPVYATSLCVLMLQVYYRYLPTFKLHKPVEQDNGNDEENDDLGLTLEKVL